MEKYEIYKKIIDDDVVVKVFDEKGNFSIASKNDPEPDYFLHYPDHDLSGWELITKKEAEDILGYEF